MKLMLLALLVGLALCDPSGAENPSPAEGPNPDGGSHNDPAAKLTVTAVLQESEHVELPPNMPNPFK
uniref:Hypothetical secreted peptide n=1 Tax=Simulium vittatum TaxID=7192 RepID=B5M0N4_SIMVI|nr:hypothetical secreted peptide precursor [Simulium vittatum]